MAAPYNASADPARLASSSRRRQHPLQPPSLLTTSLENARNAGGNIVHTPLSTTTLSSPFSGIPQSPAAAMRAVSPMALRSQNSFTGVYNPQQWGPLNNASPASSVAGDQRQGQSARVVVLAPRPVGPDGMQAPFFNFV